MAMMDPFLFCPVGVGASEENRSLTFFIYYLIKNEKNQIKMKSSMIPVT
jgi:hypothetical protein